MNIPSTVKVIAEALFYFALYLFCMFTVYPSVLASLITVLAFIAIFLLQSKNFAKEIELRKISPLICCVMPIFGAAANVLMAVVISSVPFPESWMNEYNTAISTIVEDTTAATVIFTALLAPLCEEITLRGLVHTRLRKVLPTFWAMLISSLVFGVMHGIKIQIIYAFLLGLLLAWIFEKTNSLLSPILFHIGFNVCGLVIHLYKWSLPILIIICALICALAAVYTERTSTRKIHFVRKN